jgi:hypothetical protein
MTTTKDCIMTFVSLVLFHAVCFNRTLLVGENGRVTFSTSRFGLHFIPRQIKSIVAVHIGKFINGIECLYDGMAISKRDAKVQDPTATLPSNPKSCHQIS